ncbi:hypothetical protein MNBD_GAMMA25-1638 [hydrothermal vent metagenome]|uniref:Uncharacterized protein n=1 Tax=hydrothermal vent metagenome TaxID=652676 RepID=A0A3B1BKK5_9ZZZZ
MHPVIRIICFLVFVACLSRANAGQLFLGFGLTALFLVFSSVHFFKPALTMLSRLRWFFLSIFVLYFWMTPDSPLSTDSAYLYVDVPVGVVLGLERITSLLLIIFAVSYLLASLDQKQLMAAIYWLALPVSCLGLDRNTLVLRLSMGLEAVGSLSAEPRYRNEIKNKEGAGNRFYQRFYYQARSSMQYYYQHVLCRAKEEAGKEYIFDHPGPPALWQWGFPLSLYILFALAAEIYRLHE